MLTTVNYDCLKFRNQLSRKIPLEKGKENLTALLQIDNAMLEMRQRFSISSILNCVFFFFPVLPWHSVY